MGNAEKCSNNSPQFRKDATFKEYYIYIYIYTVINKRKYACIHIHWVLIPFECAPNVVTDRFTDGH